MDGISFNEAFKELIRMWNNKIILKASFIVKSGRSLHVYWCLKGCYASTKKGASFMPTYQALLDLFARKLAHLGSDFKDSEPSRVLGVPDTYNIKSGTLREIIYPNLELVEKGIIVYQTDRRYNLIDLTDMFLEKKVTFERKKMKFNELTLAFARMEDYKILIILRNSAKINEGYRNQLLFNYGLENIDYTKSKDNLLLSLAEINSLFLACRYLKKT